MCFNCPDWVDYCVYPSCSTATSISDTSAAGTFSTMTHFYLGDEYCPHLVIRYGHKVAVLDDQEVEHRGTLEVGRTHAG